MFNKNVNNIIFNLIINKNENISFFHDCILKVFFKENYDINFPVNMHIYTMCS